MVTVDTRVTVVRQHLSMTLRLIMTWFCLQVIGKSTVVAVKQIRAPRRPYQREADDKSMTVDPFYSSS